VPDRAPLVSGVPGTAAPGPRSASPSTGRRR